MMEFWNNLVFKQVLMQNFACFLGGGSIKGMLAEIGGKMTAEAFDLILKKFDLDVGLKISWV